MLHFIIQQKESGSTNTTLVVNPIVAIKNRQVHFLFFKRVHTKRRSEMHVLTTIEPIWKDTRSIEIYEHLVFQLRLSLSTQVKYYFLSFALTAFPITHLNRPGATRDVCLRKCCLYLFSFSFSFYILWKLKIVVCRLHAEDSFIYLM